MHPCQSVYVSPSFLCQRKEKKEKQTTQNNTKKILAQGLRIIKGQGPRTSPIRAKIVRPRTKDQGPRTKVKDQGPR